MNPSRNRIMDMRTDWWLPWGRGLREGCSGKLQLVDKTFIYRKDKQQGPTV